MAVAVIISVVSIVSIGSLNDSTEDLAAQAERNIQLIIMDRNIRKRQVETLHAIINTESVGFAENLKYDYDPTSKYFVGAVVAYKAAIPPDATEEMKSRMGDIQPPWDAFTRKDKMMEAIIDIEDFYNKVDQDLEDMMTDSIWDDAPPDLWHHFFDLSQVRIDLTFYQINAYGFVSADTPERSQNCGDVMKTNMDSAISRIKGLGSASGDLGRKAREIAASLAETAIPAMNNLLVIGEQDTNAEAQNLINPR